MTLDTLILWAVGLCIIIRHAAVSSPPAVHVLGRCAVWLARLAVKEVGPSNDAKVGGGHQANDVTGISHALAHPRRHSLL